MQLFQQSTPQCIKLFQPEKYFDFKPSFFYHFLFFKFRICKILIFCFLDLVFLHLSGAFQQTEIWVLLQNYSKVFGEN